MIPTKVSLLSLVELTCPLQHCWTSLYLSSTFNNHNLENPSENQNQLFREREGPFRVCTPKISTVVVTQILTIFAAFPPYQGHTVWQHHVPGVGQTQTSCSSLEKHMVSR